MLRVGLTGGIGSGKSTVADMLRTHGATVVDADAISRQLTQAEGAAIPAIRAQFGPEFVAADGALDRNRMREASFSDPVVRRRLEAIIHPLVALETTRQEDAAVQAGAACVLFDIPLLVESRRWRQRVDHVLVVDCPPQVQIRRVVARSALNEEAVQRIIASQATRVQRVSAADTVLFNGDDGLALLARQVARLAKRFGL